MARRAVQVEGVVAGAAVPLALGAAAAATRACSRGRAVEAERDSGREVRARGAIGGRGAVVTVMGGEGGERPEGEATKARML